MAEEKKQEKKIIVDEGWKQEVKHEKEVIAAKEKIEKQKSEPTEQRGPLPSGNFAALISMLTTQALFSLGLLQMKEGEEEKAPDLELAKYHIDMLETLEEKTKGNLSKEEEKVLQNTLGQIRMAYVKATG